MFRAVEIAFVGNEHVICSRLHVCEWIGVFRIDFKSGHEKSYIFCYIYYPWFLLLLQYR